MRLYLFLALLAGCTPISKAVSVLDFGASNDGTGDCGPAFTQAASQLKLDQGGVVDVPPGIYNFDTPFQIPLFRQGATVDFNMVGAVLKTTNTIPIFDRFPTNQTQASAIIGAAIRFNGGRFVGTALPGQTGIRLSCTYLGAVNGTQFESLGVGLDAYFCLGLRVAGSRGTVNTVADWRLQSGTNSYTGIGWSGATINNSACNMSVLDGCRSYASANQPYQLGVFSSSGISVENCIFEGGNPTNNIRFDWLKSTTVKDFRIVNTHTENSPKDAILYGAWSGIILIDGLYRPNSPIVNANDTWAGAMLHIKNVPWISYAGSILFKCTGTYKPSITVENLAANSISALTTNLWQNGVIPTGVQQFSGFYAPPKIFPWWEFQTAFTGDSTKTNTASVMSMANQLRFKHDDTYTIGKGGRPKGIEAGMDGITSAGGIRTSNAFFVASQSGISFTEMVLTPGGATNLHVFAGGILVSNIANYFNPNP